MAIDFKELIGEHTCEQIKADTPSIQTPTGFCPACRAEGALRGAAQWVRENGSYDFPYMVLDAELMAAGVLGS